jgi:hypothetical protein
MSALILMSALVLAENCIGLSMKVENTITKCVYGRHNWNAATPTFPCKGFNKKTARNKVYTCLKRRGR